MLHAGLSLALAMLLTAAFGAAATAQQQRPDVTGGEAAVVADHPLAAAAGAEMLRRGGNAVDAAITMAAVLAVVRPHMNGVGGDAFMLYGEGGNGRVHAVNGSGRAAEFATLQAFAVRGLDAVPVHGVLSVSVPGAVRLWADVLRRFGTRGLEEVLAPAISLAEDGFAVSNRLAADLEASRAAIEADSAMRAVFMPAGALPTVGALLRQPDLAASLRLIARFGPDALYVGALAQRIDAFMEAENGLLRIEDLAAHSSAWQEPIATSYQRYRVLALPPNSQGVALLLQMNMAQQLDLAALPHNSPEYVHNLVEITKLAFADRDRHVTDPAFYDVPLDRLLSPEHAQLQVARVAERAAGRRDGGAMTDTPGGYPAREAGAAGDGNGDTVFLGVVDRHGNVVSMIQSLFHAFGSGRMVPGTGIVLHNRGSQFSLDPGHPNVIAPRKRPYHTLTPALALRPDGSLFMVFGTPGGDGQTQTLLQVFNNVALFGMTPQLAVEARRWRSLADGALLIEDGFAAATLDELAARGHELRRHPPLTADLGGAQVIMRLESGVLFVGADPRREAYGIAW